MNPPADQLPTLDLNLSIRYRLPDGTTGRVDNTHSFIAPDGNLNADGVTNRLTLDLADLIQAILNRIVTPTGITGDDLYRDDAENLMEAILRGYGAVRTFEDEGNAHTWYEAKGDRLIQLGVFLQAFHDWKHRETAMLHGTIHYFRPPRPDERITP